MSVKKTCNLRSGINHDMQNDVQNNIYHKNTANCIYFDYQSTTPTDERVLAEMIPFFTQKFGNPHSKTHAFGWEAENAIENARLIIADAIGATTTEIIFTSGATESNNIAIKGIARFRSKSNKKHIVTLITEHKCVLASCRELESEGFEVTYLEVEEDGIVDLEKLRKVIRDDTCLVSIMMVNHEIGVIQPIKEIGSICRKMNVTFHTDAAQAFGKIPINVREMNIDILSISGHKIYGPKGIGALFISKTPNRIKLSPIISGGGQERGMRSGTLPTPLVVGLGAATKYAVENMNEEIKRISELGEYMANEIKKIEAVRCNGTMEVGKRYMGCINFSFAYIEGESLIMAMKDFALSSGSACTSGSLEASYIIQSLGGDIDLAHSSIRFGIGRFTTKEEIEKLLIQLRQSVIKLRELSPLWDMFKDGIDLKGIVWKSH